MREQISVEAIIAAFDQTNAGPEPRAANTHTVIHTYVHTFSRHDRRRRLPIAEATNVRDRPFAIALISAQRDRCFR